MVTDESVTIMNKPSSMNMGNDDILEIVQDDIKEEVNYWKSSIV